MFCSTVRGLDVVAVEEEFLVVVVLAVEAATLEFGVVVVEEEVIEEEEEDWRLDLASSSRFSCSRSFWISFCWISDRLKNFFPPVSWARVWRFLRSSCFRRSILGFESAGLMADDAVETRVVDDAWMVGVSVLFFSSNG